MTRRILQEAGKLSKSASGTYRVCLINEGTGSSGEYPRALFTQENADAFIGALSFMNHPLDPEKPHLRPATDIVGRVGETVSVEEHDGKLGFWGDYTPTTSQPEKAAFIAEYADALGLSIYIAAGGTEVDGKYVVESLDGADPYKSVDVVVAAGRGGRFDRANEAFRSLESEPDLKPTSAQETQKKEQMDKEILEAVKALTEALAPVVTFVTEQKVAADKAVSEAEAKAEAAATDSTSAVDAYEAKVTAIDAAENLLPSQVTALKASAKAGEDITALLESAKSVADEFKTLHESEETTVFTGRVSESAVSDVKQLIPAGW